MNSKSFSSPFANRLIHAIHSELAFIYFFFFQTAIHVLCLVDVIYCYGDLSIRADCNALSFVYSLYLFLIVHLFIYVISLIHRLMYIFIYVVISFSCLSVSFNNYKYAEQDLQLQTDISCFGDSCSWSGEPVFS